MNLHIAAFATASAMLTAVLFTLCALAIAVAPRAAYGIFSTLFHVDFSGIAYSMTWGVYVGGLMVWVVGTWLTGAGLAWLYNALIRQQR